MAGAVRLTLFRRAVYASGPYLLLQPFLIVHQSRNAVLGRLLNHTGCAGAALVTRRDTRGAIVSTIPGLTLKRALIAQDLYNC